MIGAIDGRRRLLASRHEAVLPIRPEHAWIAALVLIAGVAQAVNMLHFPYVESDEGTYLSQAWAILHKDHLAAYTYWYDHAPLGWMQIALWFVLTGGTHFMGSSVASGRVLMLVVQCVSVLLLYGVVRGVTGRVWPATLAVLCFSLSSFGIYFHRRILLDNFASLWMLISIYPLVVGRLSLKRVWISAVGIAFSALSKEVTAFVIPALAMLVAHRAPRSIRWFALSGWLILTLSLASFYPLMALINGEFFPAGTELGGTHAHVSLLCTLQYQASRGRDGGVLNPHSFFWRAAGSWWRDEPLLVGGGLLGAVGCVGSFWLDRTASLLGLCTLLLWAFLARGGVVLGFYLTPLLAPLAISLATSLWLLVEAVRGPRPGRMRTGLAAGMITLVYAACGLILAIGYQNSGLGLGQNRLALWDGRQADAQQEAADWVEHNVSPASRIVIDQSTWMELHDPSQGEHVYDQAHYYWKAEADPEINRGVFGGDWRNVDYVITTSQLLADTQVSHLELVDAALQHSRSLARFDTGGWPVEVRKVDLSLPGDRVMRPAPRPIDSSAEGAGAPMCETRP